MDKDMVREMFSVYIRCYDVKAIELSTIHKTHTIYYHSFKEVKFDEDEMWVIYDGNHLIREKFKDIKKIAVESW